MSTNKDNNNNDDEGKPKDDLNSSSLTHAEVNAANLSDMDTDGALLALQRGMIPHFEQYPPKANEERKQAIDKLNVLAIKNYALSIIDLPPSVNGGKIGAGDANTKRFPIVIPGTGLEETHNGPATGLAAGKPVDFPREFLQQFLQRQFNHNIRQKGSEFVIEVGNAKLNLLAQLAVVHVHQGCVRECLLAFHPTLVAMFDSLWENLEKSLEDHNFHNLDSVARALGVSADRPITRGVIDARNKDATPDPTRKKKKMKSLPAPSSFLVSKYHLALGTILAAAGKQAFENLGSPVRQVAENMVFQYTQAFSGAKGTAGLKEKVKILRKIGEGSYGKVFLAKRVNDLGVEEIVVFKVFDTSTPALLSFAADEIESAKSLSSFPLFPDVEVTHVNDYFTIMMMEVISGGPLGEVHDQPEETVLTILSHVGASLGYLNVRKTAHRDLKPENLGVMEFVSGAKYYFMFDFGCATSQSTASTLCGTDYTMAPEVHAGGKYKPCPSDWWSTGVIALFLSLPMDSLVELYEERGKLTNGFNLERVEAELKRKKYSPSSIKLITGLLSFDPTERITPLQLLKHDALKDIPDPFKTIKGMDKFQWVLTVLEDRETKERQANEIADLTAALEWSRWKQQLLCFFFSVYVSVQLFRLLSSP